MQTLSTNYRKIERIYEKLDHLEQKSQQLEYILQKSNKH